MDKQLESALIFIRYLADIHAVICEPEEFDSRFPVFMPELQSSMASHIRQHLHGLQKPFAIHFTDLLHACYTLVGYQDYYLILGPYRLGNLRQYEAAGIIKTVRHSEKWVPVLLTNYRSLPLKSAGSIANVVRTFLLAVSGSTEYAERNIRLTIEDAADAGSDQNLPLQPATRVVSNYDNESTYMNYIRLGDTVKALEAAKNLYEPHDRLIPNPSREQLVAGFAIFRTVTRIAARDAGLTPPVLDAISRYYQNQFEQDPTSDKMAEIRHSLIRAVCSAIQSQRGSDYSPDIQQAVGYIRRNLSARISVSLIAKDISISPNRLSAKFHAETGQTITEFITLERMLSAADLLAMTALPVQEISERTGFASSAYFSRVFREHYGVSPSEYRKGRPAAED